MAIKNIEYLFVDDEGSVEDVHIPKETTDTSDTPRTTPRIIPIKEVK